MDDTLNGRPLVATHAVADGRIQISLAADVRLEAGQTLEVVMS